VRVYQQKKAHPENAGGQVIPVGFSSWWEILSDGGPPTEGKGEDPGIADDDQQRWSGNSSLLDLSFAGDKGVENRSGTNI
jgi:hypothetical protein